MNSFFEKIFVINLKRRPDRRDEVERLMAKHSVSFEFVDAVDGAEKFKDESLADYYGANFIDERKTQNWQASPGQIGCWLSHVNIWKRMVAENIQSALILEDDICFVDDFNKKFSEYFNAVPEDWNIIVPGYCGGQVTKEINDKICYIHGSGCTHAYALKLDATKILLNHHFPMKGAIDYFTGQIFFTRERNDPYPDIYEKVYAKGHEDFNNTEIEQERLQKNPEFDFKLVDKIKSYAFNPPLINQNRAWGSDI
jgi:GR25 family glycosyltransferase involved in LPS biosynthesis